MNPVDDNPLRSRTDWQCAVRDVMAPVLERASPGGARVKLGETGASFPDVDAELEGFARPLWALGPLAAGGGAFEGWEQYRSGLVNGTDPEHPEYWGPVATRSQKVVELAPIGFGLTLAPEHLWEPLEASERDAVVSWIRGVESVDLPDNNWRWFRVLATLGLRSVERDHDWERVERDVERLESFALDDGWYGDGPDRHCDYYSAWEMQTDALVYAALVDGDSRREDRIYERARAFAEEFRYWFTPDGDALPFGRSLTYRFAQGAFWGALAFADLEALPWPEVRGLWERHLRWWLAQPIFTDGGVLSLGYRYPTLKTTEQYNSPSSPYWGTKAFLPLALPETHPFWRAEPTPLPELERERAQESPAMVLCRDNGGVTALSAGADVPYGHKYTKFAYSTEFGFGVASGPRGLEYAGVDSTLVLSEDGVHVRTRTDLSDAHLEDGIPYSRWDPWPDVTVESWVVPWTPWHVRVHRLRTERSLVSVEGGFALDRCDVDVSTGSDDWANSSSSIRSRGAQSRILDLQDGREGQVVEPDPNTNLVHARTIVPTLRGEHDPGEEWLVTGVVASTAADDERLESPPPFSLEDVLVDSPDEKRTIRFR